MKLFAALTLTVCCAGAACLPVRAGRITAADLAAAVPEFAQLPAGMELGFAPSPGSVRAFPAADLQARLSRHGIAATVSQPVCFEWPMHTLTADELRAAMLTSLPPGSEVDIADPPRQAVPPGDLVFPAGALQAGIWHGYILFEPTRRFPVDVRVAVRSPWERVVAVADIRQGDRITEAHVRLETGLGEPSRTTYATSIADVVGRTPRRNLRAGAPIERASLGEARTIARGDAVRVDVLCGAARLRFDGIAEGPGVTGSLVPVRNPGTGKIVHARIEAEGRALLDLTVSEN